MMNECAKNCRLYDAYRFPGFRPEPTVRGLFGDPKPRLVCLGAPGEKTGCGTCGQVRRPFYDRKIRRVRDLSCGDKRVYLEFPSAESSAPGVAA